MPGSIPLGECPGKGLKARPGRQAGGPGTIVPYASTYSIPTTPQSRLSFPATSS
jgi:hypothetical protein